MVRETLSTLPSSDSLRDIYVGFQRGESIERYLGSSKFVEYLDYLRNMFQNVKKIRILLNPKYLVNDKFACINIDELRGFIHLRKLEEGPLEFHFGETEVEPIVVSFCDPRNAIGYYLSQMLGSKTHNPRSSPPKLQDMCKHTQIL